MKSECYTFVQLIIFPTKKWIDFFQLVEGGVSREEYHGRTGRGRSQGGVLKSY